MVGVVFIKHSSNLLIYLLKFNKCHCLNGAGEERLLILDKLHLLNFEDDASLNGPSVVIPRSASFGQDPTLAKRTHPSSWLS